MCVSEYWLFLVFIVELDMGSHLSIPLPVLYFTGIRRTNTNREKITRRNIASAPILVLSRTRVYQRKNQDRRTAAIRSLTALLLRSLKTIPVVLAVVTVILNIRRENIQNPPVAISDQFL